MPTTLSGLLLFVVLLTPGLVFVVRTESRTPAQPLSALRETASVVFVSIGSEFLVLVTFGIYRSCNPAGAPDIGALIRSSERSAYFENHYLQITLWAVGLLGVATIGAALLARPSPKFVPIAKWFGLYETVETIHRRNRPKITPDSGWGQAFHQNPKSAVYLGVELKSGTYLYGQLGNSNPQIEETDERTLQLVAPVTRRGKGDTMNEIEDLGSVIISASEIRLLFVYYHEPSK